MNHDPLCDYKPDAAADYGALDKGDLCHCELISKVRSHIASKIIQYAKDTHKAHDPRNPCPRCDIVAGYNYAAQIAKEK